MKLGTTRSPLGSEWAVTAGTGSLPGFQVTGGKKGRSVSRGADGCISSPAAAGLTGETLKSLRSFIHSGS